MTMILIVISLLLMICICNGYKFRVSFVLGAPASGKSTQCSKLVEEFGCVHLSAGDLLRKERESGSEVAELIEGYITQGAIVPVELTLRLIRQAMIETKASRFLIDGFPRNQDNLDGWINVMSDSAIVDSILFLDCPESICEERILKRAALNGRSDDNLVTLKKRFTTFKDITMPVVKYFDSITLDNDQNSNWLNKNGVKVYKVDGDRPENDVYKKVKHGYKEMIQSELLELSQQLLDAIDNNNEDRYYNLVENKQDDIKSNSNRRMSTMANPTVRIVGKSAIVSYIRLIQEEDNKSSIVTKSYEETRVWEIIEKDSLMRWNCIHTHQVVLQG